MNEKHFEVAQNLLPAIAYGDALGLPVEKRTRVEIQELYGEITQLEEVEFNTFVGRLPAGSTSDDTQLSRCVAESLIVTGGFSMQEIATGHIQALSESSVGWGQSTTNSLERLRQGISWRSSGERGGAGNGVLMKMAPLSLFMSQSSTSLDPSWKLESFTRMTHDSDIAVVSSHVHHAVLRGLINGLEPEETPEFAAVVAAKFEHSYPGASTEVSSLLGRLSAVSTIDAEVIESLTPRGGFYAPETLVMAYGSFAIKSAFPESTVAAVNLGGDADSVGSIVSAMSIMHEPTVEWPEDMSKIQELDHLRQVSNRFADLISETKN